MKLYINLRILILCLALFINSGCSVFMAANQPSKKNLDLISVGTPKAMLITEFGTPIMHENINGEITEIYKFCTSWC